MVKISRRLQIMMNGSPVGVLEKTTQGSLIFFYEKAWLKQEEARPISLSLPLADKVYQGDIVYNFFDNLLPDNQQIRARIQARFQIPTNQAFDILSIIGRDCVGAIQFNTEDTGTFQKTIQYQPLTEQKIANLLRNYQSHPLGMDREDHNFRISIAGAQEKMAFLFHENQWCEPLQSTPTSHIFKLPIGFIAHQQIDLQDSCENEWLCSELARAYGLPVADSEILQFEDKKVLSVARFDRMHSTDQQWIMRLPQEDICQALGLSSNLKYQSDGGPGIEEIMHFLLGSSMAIEDRELFFRTQVFFWLIAGIDGHAKNFSIFIEPKGKYRLTPLYDIISAYPLIKKHQLQEQKIKMAMALKGKNTHYHWQAIQQRHFLETAKKIHFSKEKAQNIIQEMIEKTDSAIEVVANKLPSHFPNTISDAIFEGLRKAKRRLSKA